jgi:hypothetical protein
MRENCMHKEKVTMNSVFPSVLKQFAKADNVLPNGRLATGNKC